MTPYTKRLIAPCSRLGHKRQLWKITMEDAMTNYLPAIDIMMCHLGISFEQACEQLGLSPQEQQTLDQLQKQKQTQSN